VAIANRIDEVVDLAGGLGREHHHSCRRLSERDIHLGLRPSHDLRMAHVAHDPDDREPRRQRRHPSKSNPAACRLGRTERAPRKGAIDDGDLLPVSAIARVKHPPGCNRNPQRAEVVVRDDAVVRRRLAARLRWGIAVDQIPGAAVVGTERQRVDERRRAHPWNARDGVDRLLEETALRVGVGVAILRQRDRHRQHPIGHEAGVEMPQCSKCANESSRHQQDDG
jgi:hypothetical protein